MAHITAPIGSNRPNFSSPTTEVGASIGKIKYTHANIIFKGTIQRKDESNCCHEKNYTEF
jgi:hypothetical protein